MIAALRAALPALALCAGLATTVQAAPVAGALTAAEVKSRVVGHSVTNDDKSMTWYYRPGGKWEGDDGRRPHGGTYTVEADGRLCWKDLDAVTGCFLYVRKGASVILRRVDAGHDFELGTVTFGSL